jgi:hypothetical protein
MDEKACGEASSCASFTSNPVSWSKIKPHLSGYTYRPRIAGVWIGDDPSQLPRGCNICDKLHDQSGAVDLAQYQRQTQEIIYAQGTWWLCTSGLLGCFGLLDRERYLPQE